MSAKIVTDSGGGPAVGSAILLGSQVGTPVLLTNLDNTGVSGWRWEIIDAPPESPTLYPLPGPVFTTSHTIANDVKGQCVLIRLTTYQDVARTILDDVDQVIIGVRFDPPFDWLIPAAGQSLESNMIRGWAQDVNEILREAHEFMEGGGSVGTLTLVTSHKTVREGTSMLFAGGVTIDLGGELDIEGDVEDTEHFQNHAIVVVPRRSERVVQENEVMFFTELTIDGTLTIDGDIEDISPVPFPTPPTVGELGELVITAQPNPAAFTAEAGKLYQILQATLNELTVTLPGAPTNGDTVGFYTGPGNLLVDVELFLGAGANDISAPGWGNAEPFVNLPISGGELILVTWGDALSRWEVYGSTLNRLGGTGQTTDATPFNVAQYIALGNEAVISLHVEVLACDSGNDLVGHWIAEVTARNDGAGTVTVLEDVLVKAYKDNPNWDIQFNTSGETISVDVVGDVGNTVEWRVRGTVKEHG